ncbi:DUF4331 family protein [Chryseolinea sp. H1M3-3]|uniref:DUF4331 family protein n=1 Tax=Chryseolinea sp. H1M3-3 TaxID=3034144 RepID=UPI0023EC4846|nr:DUF4331 family protein [Chryseolinea sp. H1M3-3]
MRLKLNLKSLGLALVVFVACAASYLIAADHIDAPAVTGTGSDITDVYAFQSPANSSNMVFVVNVQGLLAPSATAAASFDEEVMIEVNIDNSSTKDNMEDLVIQATFDNGKVKVFGPEAPAQKGLMSTLLKSTPAEATVTSYGANPVIGESNGIKVFAGPRDDPFFFDLNQFKAIIGGTATSFNNPGADAFAGTNVLALVIEVPKSMLGSDAINIWATSNRKM